MRNRNEEMPMKFGGSKIMKVLQKTEFDISWRAFVYSGTMVKFP
jgi:hypothetical protein